MEGIDLTNRKILVELDKNARQSNTELAKKLKTSRDVVAYRIKQMEDMGLIIGYNPIIDTSAIGYTIYRVYFKFFGLYEEKFKELINMLLIEKSVWRVHGADGNWDLYFSVFVRDPREFREIYTKVMKKFRSYIQDKNIETITKYVHLHKSMILDGKKPIESEITVGHDVQDFDDIDIRILSNLWGVARKGYTQIANELGLDKSTVKYRMQNMEKKGIIQNYRVRIAFSRFGYAIYSVRMELLDLHRVKELENYVKTLPETSNVIEAINGADLEFGLYIEDDEDYFRIIDDIKNRFDFIASIDYFRVLKTYKNIYQPEPIDTK